MKVLQANKFFFRNGGIASLYDRALGRPCGRLAIGLCLL